MGKVYIKPPVIEAVCEFRLTSDTKWDLTIPGLVYEKLKEDFPIKEQREIQEFDVIQDPDGVKQRVKRSDRVLFFKEDKKLFIQVGPHFLAINCLKPYPKWEMYKPNISKAFGVLSDVLETIKLRRIGLQYRNRIDIPGNNIDLDDYFEFGINLGRHITQPMVDFIAGCTLSFSENSDLCRIQLTNITSDIPETTTVLLDINYFLVKPRSFTKEETMNWIEEAHTRIEEIFEGCLKDKLRELFEEVR